MKRICLAYLLLCSVLLSGGQAVASEEPIFVDTGSGRLWGTLSLPDKGCPCPAVLIKLPCAGHSA